MDRCSLKVLVVAEDRRLLRQLARFLTTFGYRVRSAHGQAAAQAVLTQGTPEIVLLDGAVPWALSFCQSLWTLGERQPIRTLLLLERADARQLVDAVAAGVDDFLQRPLVYGELLARMRAAARALSCEENVRCQEGDDPLTGLSNEASFLLALRQGLGERTACVVVDLDGLSGVNRWHGRCLGDALLVRTAEALRQLAPETPLAHLGAGRFAALLPGVTVLEGEAWAEQARQAIAHITLESPDGPLAFTASAGLATVKEGCRGEELLAKACEALRLAKQSGGNFTVRAGQFHDEMQAWSELASPGKLFERTRARDVMMPVPVVLREEDSARRAVRLLAQCHLEALPVVSNGGTLCGLVTTETPLGDPDALVADILTREITRFEETAPFGALLDYFATASQPWAAVVQGEWPTGLLTLDHLALLSQPITREPATISSSDTCTAAMIRAEALVEAIS